MNRQMLRKSIATVIPQWLPVKYPAFPVSSSTSLHVFLAMLTAVHGYSDGLVTVLRDIFRKASRAGETALYLNELKKILS